MYLAFTIFTLLMSILFTKSSIIADQRLIWLTKTLASLGFVVFGLTAAFPVDDVYGRFIFIGFIFCFLGDLALIPRSDKWFMAGILLFLTGHVFYIFAFNHIVIELTLQQWAYAGLPVVLLSGVLTKLLWPKIPMEMKFPVLIYVLVITLMLISALAYALSRGEWLPLLAAAFFYLSDSVLAFDKFDQATKFRKIICLPAYYTAQILFCWSLV